MVAVKHASQQGASLIEGTNRLPESTRIEYAQFLVPELNDSLHFYRDLLGLRETWYRGNTKALSASTDGTPLVMLSEDRAARPRPIRSAGLYHLALLYPTRRDLAAAFMRLHEQDWKFHGFADHGVSEALYTADADGNGIELYVDRPRDRWPSTNGELEMVTKPLDLDNLLSELGGNSQPESDERLTIGHIHLQVTNLQSADVFYHETLGFDVTQRSFPGALFVAAGGYHHHIGLNVWNSRGGSPSKEGTAGLVRFGIRAGSNGSAQALLARLRKTPNWLRETERGIIVHDADNIEIEIL
jgi:catechol 2,3-dioxygenase